MLVTLAKRAFARMRDRWPAYFIPKGARTMIIYALKPSTEGQWNICRSGFCLFSDLRLGPAITLAREVARDEHSRSGRAVCVEMPGLGSAIRLAQYETRAIGPRAVGAFAVAG